MNRRAAVGLVVGAMGLLAWALVEFVPRGGSPPAATANPAVEPSQRRDAALAPTARLTVDLTEGESQRPVAGVALDFTREPIGPDSPRRRGISDAAGRIEIDEIPVGRWRAIADDDHVFVHPVRSSVDVLPDAGSIPIPLVILRGARVEGRVVDPRGEPVAGASVVLRPNGPEDDERLGFALERRREGGLETWTDADGRFVVRGVPRGVSYDSLARHPDFAPSPPRRASVGRDEDSTALPKIVLSRGASLVVSVTSGGVPVEGAGVRIRRLGTVDQNGTARGGAREPIPATTGADGKALVERLAPGSYLVQARSAVHCPSFRIAEVSDGLGARVDVALEVGRTVSGSVEDVTGRPIPRASVEVRCFGDSVRATTDGRGRYHLAGLPKDLIEIEARAEGFADATTLVADGVAEPSPIVMDRATSVAGRVVDPSGQPVRDFTLEIRGRRADAGAVLAVAEADGRFRTPPLAPGEYVLRAEAKGRGLGSGESAPIAVAGGGEVGGVTIAVGWSTWLRARVVDAETRAPVPGAIVTWSDDGSSGDAWGIAKGRSSVSGPDGVLDVDVPELADELFFQCDGFLPETIAPVPAKGTDGAAALTVFLRRGARLAGVVSVPGSIVEALGTGRAYERVAAGSDGAYEIAGLRPGSYVVGVCCGRDDRAWSECAKVEVGADESVRVDFVPGARRGSAIRGRVLGPDDRPLDGEVSLDVDDPESFFPERIDMPSLVALAQDGAFEFAGVPGGRWRATARTAAGDTLELVETDGATPATLEFRVGRGGLVVSVVDAASGEPVVGIHVDLEMRDGRTLRGWSGEDGRREFDGVMAGSATLHVEWGETQPRDGRAPYPPSRTSVTIPQQGPAAVTVAMSLGAMLEGRVTAEGGEPVGAIDVVLVPDAENVLAGEELRAEATPDGYRVTGLAPGGYAAVVRGAGWAPRVERLTIADDAPARRDFALARGEEIRFVVVDAEQRPVPDAIVRCRLPSEDVDVAVAESDGGAPMPLRLTPGRYAFRAFSAERGAFSAYVAFEVTCDEPRTLTLEVR